MPAKIVYTSLLFLLFIFLSFSFFSSIAYAQLGEEAGQPDLNVSVGSSTVFNYSILNAGSSPINFTVILPALNTIPHNVTPTVSITPMNGTLAPHSSQTISIMVSVPYGDKVGLSWQGVVQVVESSSGKTVSSGGASATITAGVAKILTIHSTAPKGIPLVYLVIIAVIVVIVIVLVYYYAIVRKKAKAKAAERAAKLAAAKRRITGKAAAAKAKARKPAAKKAAARSSATKSAKARPKATSKAATARTKRR